VTAAWHVSNHDGYSAFDVCKFPACSVTLYYTFQDLLRYIVKQEAWLARRMDYACGCTGYERVLCFIFYSALR